MGGRVGQNACWLVAHVACRPCRRVGQGSPTAQAQGGQEPGDAGAGGTLDTLMRSIRRSSSARVRHGHGGIVCARQSRIEDRGRDSFARPAPRDEGPDPERVLGHCLLLPAGPAGRPGCRLKVKPAAPAALRSLPALGALGVLGRPCVSWCLPARIPLIISKKHSHVIPAHRDPQRDGVAYVRTVDAGSRAPMHRRFTGRRCCQLTCVQARRCMKRARVSQRTRAQAWMAGPDGGRR